MCILKLGNFYIRQNVNKSKFLEDRDNIEIQEDRMKGREI